MVQQSLYFCFYLLPVIFTGTFFAYFQDFLGVRRYDGS